MSELIALPAVRRRASAVSGTVRAMLLSLLILFVHSAGADPVLAGQQFDDATHGLTQIAGYYHRGRVQMQFGEGNAAAVSFARAHEWAMETEVSLVALRYQYQHTLDNGLYRNGAAQQQAINHGEVAISLVRQVQMRLMILRTQPNSQVDSTLAGQLLGSLEDRVDRIELAMVAAQQ